MGQSDRLPSAHLDTVAFNTLSIRLRSAILVRTSFRCASATTRTSAHGRFRVSLKAKEAVVTFDPAQVTVQKMIAAVDGLGFRATLKQQ